MTGVALLSSGEEEQPATNASASAANAAPNLDHLASIGGAHQFRAVPPAAAERLEQSGSVGEAIGFGLDEAEPRLLIGLIGIQNGEVSGVSVLVLEPRQIEAGLCGVGRLCRRL
jgi:hypothetical protein